MLRPVSAPWAAMEVALVQPVLDPQRLAELEAEIGADGLAIVFDAFLEEAEAGLGRLRAAVACASGAGPAAQLHALRGAAANIGAAAFGALCEALERAPDGPIRTDVDALEALLAAIRSESRRTAA